MRWIFVLAMATVALAAAPTTVRAADEWKLVWRDEFDGDKLDVKKWGYEVNAFGGGNQELQIYTDRDENVRVEDGRLVIEARRDRYGIAGTSREYSSGRIRTKRRGDWKYGKVEVRARLPQGQGLWPAIWMLPTDDHYGGWALSGEIDIMEGNGRQPRQIWGTLHYGGSWPDNTHSGEIYKLPGEKTFADEFHTFAIEWEKGVIRWYVDGKLWQTQTKWRTKDAVFPAPFDQRFHLILNLAVGGQFVGAPDNATKFPAKMEVDWVRIYQRNAAPKKAD